MSAPFPTTSFLHSAAFLLVPLPFPPLVFDPCKPMALGSFDHGRDERVHAGLDALLLAVAQVPGYIVHDPEVCRGKAVVQGTRIKVSELTRRYEFMGQSPDDIVAELPHLSLAQVHAALAYYYDHRDDILAELQAEDDFVQRLAASYAAPAK